MWSMHNGNNVQAEKGHCQPPAQTYMELQWTEETRAGYEEHCKKLNYKPEPCLDYSTEMVLRRWRTCPTQHQIRLATGRVGNSRCIMVKDNKPTQQERETLNKLIAQLDTLQYRPPVVINADELCKTMNIIYSHHTHHEPALPSCDMCEQLSQTQPEASAKQISETFCNMCEAINQKVCNILGLTYDIGCCERRSQERIKMHRYGLRSNKCAEAGCSCQNRNAENEAPQASTARNVIQPDGNNLNHPQQPDNPDGYVDREQDNHDEFNIYTVQNDDRPARNSKNYIQQENVHHDSPQPDQQGPNNREKNGHQYNPDPAKEPNNEEESDHQDSPLQVQQVTSSKTKTMLHSIAAMIALNWVHVSVDTPMAILGLALLPSRLANGGTYFSPLQRWK